MIQLAFVVRELAVLRTQAAVHEADSKHISIPTGGALQTTEVLTHEKRLKKQEL
jgi:hypothetical protein